MGETTDVGELDELDVLDDPDLLRPAPQRWHRRTAIEMIVSGVLGLVASFVLSIEAWQLAGDSTAVFSCDINQALSCGAVARTWQAHLLGFPNAFLGILFEAIVLTISVSMFAGVRFPRLIMFGAEGLYTIGLFFALWLFSQSYFVIHALCPWCLLITFTTTLVWAGLTRINVRDGNLPSTPGMRRFVAAGSDWFVTVAVCVVIVVMVVVRYGGSFLA
jgi:uncharacterized membrane protein